MTMKVPALAKARLDELIEKESDRAKTKVDELSARFPTATPRELSQHLIEQKKQMAAVVGGVTGVFGLATVPVDLAGMVYLQLSLLVEVATVFKVNLRLQRTREELLDLFGYSNGLGPVKRVSPKVVGSLVALLLSKGGMATLARAMPLIAAPVSAYLNNQHVQRIGDSAVRHYAGWGEAHEKSKRASEG